MATLATGSVFAGHRIEGPAGKGGMGVVYRATDLQLDRPVALKLVAGEFAEDPAFAERFKRESRLAASLDHPNVIPIYHAGEEDGRLFVTMRLVDGTDLAEVLRRDGRLAPARAVEITGQVAAALDAAHARGLVHRDVKPANVLLEGEHVFLSDFGLSKDARSDSGLTDTGALLGTVDYIAPEQAQGGVVDARSDVYALGCVLYQMLSGRVPFERPSAMAKLVAHVSDEPPTVKDVPEPLAAVVKRAMEKEPGRRFQSAGELALAAADALGVSLGTPARKQRRQIRPIAIGAAAVAAIAVVVAVLATGGGGGSGGAHPSNERPAVMALLKRLHAGFTVKGCRSDLTENFRATYFEPRSGREALNACFNSAGGPPNKAPFILYNLQILGDAAKATADVENERVTFYLLKHKGRWLANDFSETPKRRYERQATSAVQPSFRNTASLDAFTIGRLPLGKADGIPARAVDFLSGAAQQLARLDPPAGFADIHQRLRAGLREMLSASRAAVAAQQAKDAPAFKRADREVFAGLKKVGTALGEISRAQ